MRATRKTRAFAGMFTAALLLAISPAIAAPQTCPDPMFRIDDPASGDPTEICALASETKQRLSECGLKQTRPIEIHLTDRLIHAGHECLAIFDCETDRISIVSPQAIPPNLADGDSYALLPPEVVFRALLVHEMTHGFLQQTVGPRDIHAVDQEYVAAAMELEALAPAHRDTLLKANPVTPPIERETINIWIYLMSPRGFAVASWLHFRDPGCDLVRAIAAGRFTFDMGEL